MPISRVAIWPSKACNDRSLSYGDFLVWDGWADAVSLPYLQNESEFSQIEHVSHGSILAWKSTCLWRESLVNWLRLERLLNIAGSASRNPDRSKSTRPVRLCKNHSPGSPFEFENAAVGILWLDIGCISHLAISSTLNPVMPAIPCWKPSGRPWGFRKFWILKTCSLVKHEKPRISLSLSIETLFLLWKLFISKLVRLVRAESTPRLFSSTLLQDWFYLVRWRNLACIIEGSYLQLEMFKSTSQETAAIPSKEIRLEQLEASRILSFRKQEKKLQSRPVITKSA
jgi:hypothetical protein